MENGAAETCTCGVEGKVTNGPTHRYMLSTASCWEAYGRLLAKEYEHPALMRKHRLTVDAYAAQHPGVNVVQARNSVGVHLSRLALLLDERWEMERANDAMLAITAKKREYPLLTPPKLNQAGTFLPVITAPDIETHEAAVWKWANGVWHAWASHHATVRSWLHNAGLLT